MESSVTRVIDLRRYGQGSLPDGFKQMLIDVHADAYAEAMDDEFNQRFPWFVDHWSGMSGFTCVVAFDGDEPTGFAYGAPLQPGREWWRSTDFKPNNGYTATYAVSEVMVRPKWRKQGISDRLHEALLEDVRDLGLRKGGQAAAVRRLACLRGHGEAPAPVTSPPLDGAGKSRVLGCLGAGLCVLPVGQARRAAGPCRAGRSPWCRPSGRLGVPVGPSLARFCAHVATVSFFELATDRVMGHEAQRARPRAVDRDV
jgi:GNAT superfamily N-acetyltransferase